MRLMRCCKVGSCRLNLLALSAVVGSSWLVSHEAPGAPPRPDHVVVVIEENHSYDQLLGPSSPAGYTKWLASVGASFTNSFAVEHPSQPNYLDLFSGANQGTGGTDAF